MLFNFLLNSTLNLFGQLRLRAERLGSRFRRYGLEALRKRLRVKTSPAVAGRASVLFVPTPRALVGIDVGEEADEEKARTVYLVTLSHPT